jgi:pyruvate ferredoxin oxidoreductase gamma subunit
MGEKGEGNPGASGFPSSQKGEHYFLYKLPERVFFIFGPVQLCLRRGLMIEIRFHGRGGQGAVTSAELLAVAAINEGRYAQAFPSFGPERRGAPVVAYCRIDDHPIKIRASISKPDLVLVLDGSILKIVDVASGLKPDGTLVTNSHQSAEEVRSRLKIEQRVATVNATKIAMEVLGLPITNTTMLGSLIKASGVVDRESMIEPLRKRFGRIAEKNIAAYQRAFEETEMTNAQEDKQ